MNALADLIDITSTYSNAVVAAALACIQDANARLNLEVKSQATSSHVARVWLDPSVPGGSSIWLNDGSSWDVEKGRVVAYKSARIGNERLAKNQGDSSGRRLADTELITLARKHVLAMGADAEGLYMDLPPKLRPHYGTDSCEVAWEDPTDLYGFPVDEVRVEMDWRTGLVLVYRVAPSYLTASDIGPRIAFAIRPQAPDPDVWRPPESDKKALQACLIDAFLDLRRHLQKRSDPGQVTDANIREVDIEDQWGTTHARLVLTSGEELLVYGKPARSIIFHDGQEFFSASHVRLRAFIHKAKLGQDEVIAAAKAAVVGNGLSGDEPLFGRRPEIHRPNVTGPVEIPRRLVIWQESPSRKAEAEVDAGDGRVHAICIREMPVNGSVLVLLREMDRVFSKPRTRPAGSP